MLNTLVSVPPALLQHKRAQCSVNAVGTVVHTVACDVSGDGEAGFVVRFDYGYEQEFSYADIVLHRTSETGVCNDTPGALIDGAEVGED
eukprot:2823868-Rhodomonas_salina.1